MMNQSGRFELVRRCLDGEASQEEWAQFEALLREEPEFRRDYLRYLNVDSGLAELPRAVASVAESVDRVPQPARNGVDRLALGDWWKVAAVLVVFVGGIWGAFYQGFDRNRTSAALGEERVHLAELDDNGVAVLTRVAGLQGTATDEWRTGATIPPGTMEWDAGLLQLEFYGGATLVAEGPAKIEVLDESRVICHLGRLRAHVPEPARGFKVLAPAFELVDLGTEFGLNVVDGGAAEVHVFDGKVELYDAASNRSAESRFELNAGDALAVDRDGAAQTIPVQDSEFVTPVRLIRMADARRQDQHRDWRTFRDSLRNESPVVAYFPFGRTDSEDRLLVGYGVDDSSINGAIVGCEWSEGRWPDKPSLQFKRPGDRVRVVIPGEFQSLTYSIWLRLDGLDRTHHSLLLTDGYGENGIHWQIRQDGALVLGMRDSENRPRNYQSDSIFNLFRLGQWVHLATVYDTDGGRVTHYVNGKPAKRIALKEGAARLLKIGNATIGNWSVPRGGSVRNFNGCIDELIVYGQALADQEVRRIYEVGKP